MKEAPADKTASPPHSSEAPPIHWSRQKEEAAGYGHLKFLLILFRFFPLVVLRILAFPVGFSYFLFSKRSRTESKRFLQKAAPFVKNPKIKKKCLSRFGPARHIISFSLTLVEKLQSWSGKFFLEGVHFQDDDAGQLIDGLEKGQGAFLITSHLGNVELLRALVSFNRTSVAGEVPITAVIDMKVTENFNRIIRELNPKSVLDVVSADDMGPHTAIFLEERLASGGIVTIAGDRTKAGGFDKNIMIPFLGEDAPFSPGPFYLAALMKAPVYFIFARRRGDLSIKPEYDMHIHKADLSRAEESRKERTRLSSELARSFAAFLESYCNETPFQWYNFYDFWSKGV